jgi:hypothetical protein
MIITLAQAKKQLNIESDFTDDDDYISELIDVSAVIIANDINRDLATISVLGVAPTPIQHAAKIMIGHLYKHREVTTEVAKMEVVPLSYTHLISAYKNFTLG